MGKGRQKRRKLSRKRRPRQKTKRQLLTLLVTRPHKWTTLKRLADAAKADIDTVDRMMSQLATNNLVAMQTCARWEGGWRYRPLPKCWPSDADIRGMIMAEATELGVANVSVTTLAENVSNQILGFVAPNTVARTIFEMRQQGELEFVSRRLPGIVMVETDRVSVPVNQWLKRTSREQARARA